MAHNFLNLVPPGVAAVSFLHQGLARGREGPGCGHSGRDQGEPCGVASGAVASGSSAVSRSQHHGQEVVSTPKGQQKSAMDLVTSSGQLPEVAF